jgi:hypothetical protein
MIILPGDYRPAANGTYRLPADFMSVIVSGLLLSAVREPSITGIKAAVINPADLP